MGWVICKTVPYLQGVSVSASINTLVAISVERCLAICYPLKWQMTSRACRVVVICTESWPSPDSGNVYFVVAHLVMCYLFPLTLISVCYLLIWRRVCRRTLPGEPHPQGGVMDMMIQRSKVKVIKMLLVVVVSFALSWLPLYVLFTRVKFGGPFSESEEAAVHAILPVAQWLGASNSCVNPILYAFFNKKFRAGFKAIVTSKSCCTPIRYNNEYYSTSVKSTFSCRMNTKNGSILMSKKALNPSSSTKTRVPTTGSNLQRHHSASTAAVYKINKVNENYNNNYTNACKNPTTETGHHIIKSSSVSALSHLNATAV
ncbi:hypothetical protein C0J52_03617 [Blattella germanica]|nr:hypothetical protein C0J52_03617 [Blattella germanica]